jgi:hypothetical protein
MLSEGKAPPPKNGEPTVFLFNHDNAPAHRSVLVNDFLAKNNVTTLQYPSYSTDVVPTDFYLFLGLTPALKGQRFCNATENIKNVADELKRISFLQNGFQEYFKHLYSRWQKCYI